MFGEAIARSAVSQTIDNKGNGWTFAHQVSQLAFEVRSAVLVEGDSIDRIEAYAPLSEAKPNSFAREAPPMLDAAKALFFRGCDQEPIAYKARRGVTVKGIETEDDQVGCPFDNY